MIFQVYKRDAEFNMSKMQWPKKTKETVLGVVIFVFLVAVVILVYRNEVTKPHRELAKRIAEITPGGGTPRTIDGLKEAIALYEAQIELNVKEGAQTGAYWKILAVRLADKGMHRDALSALERAIYFDPADPTLLFLTGESASIVAANALQFSVTSSSEKEHFYQLAESAYKRAIENDPMYAKPLLSLGILYVFDLERPLEAIPLLRRYINLMPNDIKAFFVLARAYYMTENYEEAVELYDRILSKSKDPTVRTEAQNNREFVRSLING
jgi:tetratricopeptide (TPR) repeat protein